MRQYVITFKTKVKNILCPGKFNFKQAHCGCVIFFVESVLKQIMSVLRFKNIIHKCVYL